MSFLSHSILRSVRQPCLISNLANSLRALSVAPPAQQRRSSAIATPLEILPKPSSNSKIPKQISSEELNKCKEVFNNVNQQLAAGKEGRLFAVVQLCGKQFKITAGDIILVEGYWPPNIGDEIRLEKVLLAGAKDFTLIGRPILDAGLVNIKATVIEKTLTHTKTHFKKKRRKQFMRINFQRSPNTMIRINTIEIGQKVDANPENNDIRLF